jgi:hypothetical protein
VAHSLPPEYRNLAPLETNVSVTIAKDELIPRCLIVLDVLDIETFKHIARTGWIPKTHAELGLSKGDLDLVKAFVMPERPVSRRIMDGTRGLIFLLHGCRRQDQLLLPKMIATLLRRPLRRIQCSDLLKATDFTTELTSFLSGSPQSETILLADEAEFLLRERTGNNLSENALISIIFHELEKFEGILFFSSSRRIRFDKTLMWVNIKS